MNKGHAVHGRNARAPWALCTILVPTFFAFATPVSALECRGQDISGATSCWSESSSGALRSFPINLVDLPNAVIGGITHRMRDNEVSHYTVTLNPGGLFNSWLSLQVAGTTFGPETTQHVEDPEAYKAFVRRIAGSVEFGKLTRIKGPSRSGWVGPYKSDPAAPWCYAVLLGLEPSPWGADMAEELYEMFLGIKDCTGRRTLEELKEWLHAARAVPEGYNGK